jgi:type VI secretion system protein ImpE
MDSGALLQEGRLEEALAALKDEVRRTPGRVESRVNLFALNCVLGRLDKASADLQAIRAVDNSWTVPAQVYESLIKAELLRREVFAGRNKPVILGDPEPWLAWNVQALAVAATGKGAEAANLNNQAFEAAPEYGCRVDGSACLWLSDSDRRLGPALEAVLEGKYYWISFGRLRTVEITPPEFLVETVWIPARLGLVAGAELAAHLPVRYAGTEDSTDGPLRLGRKTEWAETPGGGQRPLGQKMVESDSSEFGLLSCRRIEFENRPELDPSMPPV